MPRFLTIVMHNERTQPTEDPSPELQRRMGELFEEISKAGVMLDMGELTRTPDATRLTWTGGELSQTDGPFTESKEVVGGYTIIQAKDKAEALEWARRFGDIQGLHEDLTAEVRQISED
ncbi:transcriptional regulator [Streptomyces armeniacus]|uniref:Transcriptional regulator n=1 Tax=Streptomyces armeniacus TaxID=83291 RepID=A0A345XKK1_9ACTN|nr:YciI family protein [Streptomyces armeniacus]AXK32167.1 transcriptional regulator [Streptomyces armeniacus]